MNTKEEIISFKPKHEYFIGIDSDGTVFDSMNIKHIKSMFPAATEVWNFGDRRAEFETTWNKINLYSSSRGTNRFLGLLDALEKIPPCSADLNLSPLRDFTKNAQTLSNAALQAYMTENPSPLLTDVMRWSKRSDELFDKYTEGLLPFANVKNCIAVMAQKADVMVVSSASGKGLDKDWSFSGLTQYTSLVAGQEAGSKNSQLKMGAAGKYSSEKILMIGDAPGDLEAARSIDALFFPIMPGTEEKSWQVLQEEALPRFFTSTYKGDYEDKLVKNFLSFLE